MQCRRQWSVLAVAFFGCGPFADPVPVDNPNEGGSCDIESPLVPRCSRIRGPQPQKKLDVLLVVDATLSTAEEQPRLARSLEHLVTLLDAPGIRANYRLALVSSDAPNPQCDSDEANVGAFRAIACVDRPEDFVSIDGAEDRYAESCQSVCPIDSGTFELLPTPLEVDEEPRVRPWIESVGGVNNVAGGVETSIAAACLAPQGARACSFTSPILAATRALQRAADAEDPAFGFLRADARLLVLFLSDAADCSLAVGGGSVFDPDGNRVFWSDPDSNTPTRAVCWNAGVTCTGDPSGYETCDTTHKDHEGVEGVPASDAVLLPLEEAVGVLDEISRFREELGIREGVLVGALVGVNEEGAPAYSGLDPDDALELGIDAGCVDEQGGRASPPARLRDLVDAEDPTLYSVCEADYDAALTDVGERVVRRFGRGCFSECAEDVEPETAGLQVDCELQLEYGVGNWTTVTLPECARDTEGDYLREDGVLVPPSPEDDVCYAVQTDVEGMTEDPFDDLHPECAESGFNVGFYVEVRPGVRLPTNSITLPSCRLAPFKQETCPDLI